MKLPAHKTKIVCTIGPASGTPGVMADMILAGMNVARLNFSHGDFPSHEKMIQNLREAAPGTANDYGGAKASGVNRDLNRGVIDAWEVEKTLEDPNSKLSLLFSRGREQILVRRRERSFHPGGGQKTVHLSPRVFALLRTAPEGDEEILTLTGVTSKAVELSIPLDKVAVRHRRYHDLLSGMAYQAKGNVLHLTLPPYGRIWLKVVS